MSSNGNSIETDAFAQSLEAYFSSSSSTFSSSSSSSSSASLSCSTPPQPIPLDISSSSSSSVSSTSTLSWGILGAGRVSHDFVQSLKALPQAKVVAVGASALGKAKDFARTHAVAKAYGSYKEVVGDAEVQVVYVGTLHAFHKEHALLAIEAGKHVLVEKPVACTGKDAEEMVARAKAKGVLFLEGVWTRFFPVVEMARHLISTGAIGRVVALHADFGFNSSDSETYPDSPFFRHGLGGGGLLFVGVYPISMAPLSFGTRMPTKIAAAGVVDTPTGVDLSGGVVLEYEGGREGGGVAVLTYNLMGETPEETTIVGTEGRIKILGPAHCPTKMVVSRKNKGRGNVEDYVFEYALPTPLPAVVEAGGFNYPNSQGFMYEAAAVQRCVEGGRVECPQYSMEETLVVARIMDEVRRQLGVKEVGEE